MTAHLFALLVTVGLFLGLAFGMVTLGWLTYRLSGYVKPQVRVATAVLVIGLGAVLSVVLTQRDLDDSVIRPGHMDLYADYAEGFAASRWLSLVLLGLAAIEVVRGWVYRRRMLVSDPAWPVLLALLLYYVGTLVIQALLSEHTGISYKDLYVPILFVFVYYQTVDDLTLVLRAAKLVILLLTGGSLAAMALWPDFVLHRPEVGWIPGIDWRLYGLTPHANTLGPVALLGLILEFYLPYRSKVLRAVNLGAAVVVLVLAQSRTAWAAGILIWLTVHIPLSFSDSRSQGPDHAFRHSVRFVLIGAAVLSVAACVLTQIAGSDYVLQKTELGTLNGRFLIWDITLQAWNENPMFGYGPDVWGLDRRVRFNLMYVGQAHDQFVQTLGEAGIAGLILLILYLLVMLVVALRRFSASRGLVLALFVLLITRCVTESPMRSEGLLTWATFLHVMLLQTACYALRSPAPTVAHAHPPTGSMPTDKAQRRNSGLRVFERLPRRAA